jgi:hypothetical protein
MSDETLVTHHNMPVVPPSPPHRRSGVRLFLLAPIVLCLVGAVTLFLRALERQKTCRDDACIPGGACFRDSPTEWSAQ